MGGPGPLFPALDRDHDGQFSSKEIAGAVESLKTLDRDRDGKITEDEFRPRGGPGGLPPG
jgi:Ca2+-binding EF-hand superfamily protein